MLDLIIKNGLVFDGLGAPPARLDVGIKEGVIAALLTRNPWLPLLAPLSQITGLAGHYFFERSHIDLQDAVFSIRDSRCLNRMFFKLITGGYGRELSLIHI